MATANLSEKSVDFTITLRYPRDYSENNLSLQNESNDSFPVEMYPVRWKATVCPHYL